MFSCLFKKLLFSQNFVASDFILEYLQVSNHFLLIFSLLTFSFAFICWSAKWFYQFCELFSTIWIHGVSFKICVTALAWHIVSAAVVRIDFFTKYHVDLIDISDDIAKNVLQLIYTLQQVSWGSSVNTNTYSFPQFL